MNNDVNCCSGNTNYDNNDNNYHNHDNLLNHGKLKYLIICEKYKPTTHKLHTPGSQNLTPA